MEAAISCKFHCKRLAEHWGASPCSKPALQRPAGLVARLHTAGAPPRSFIHIPDYVASWEIPHRDEQEG